MVVVGGGLEIAVEEENEGKKVTAYAVAARNVSLLAAVVRFSARWMRAQCRCCTLAIEHRRRCFSHPPGSVRCGRSFFSSSGKELWRCRRRPAGNILRRLTIVTALEHRAQRRDFVRHGPTL